MKNTSFSLLLIWFLGSSIYATAQHQTQTNSYTRYELLAPETNSFRILYGRCIKSNAQKRTTRTNS